MVVAVIYFCMQTLMAKITRLVFCQTVHKRLMIKQSNLTWRRLLLRDDG